MNRTPVSPRALHPSVSSGFTLIEVLVVVVILAILAAVVVPKVMEHPGEARAARAKADIQALVTALRTYKLDNFNYPSTEQGLQALIARPTGAPEAPNWRKDGYLDQRPKDPWGRDYLYLSPGSHGDIDVYTLGADGRPGGEGENADIGNWVE
ncbi:type II secretion system major pseudopilin GspG [Tahibacter amnicola]|uniref:Type II secretion system core protein G n=1 Tax=Tahibacter amnicola TaxID=2976241 RepID=A0ABY6BBY5_9GAMM|nr:type II secretion system major pseudopilin GspG [Tahibacter amnicola]UXI67568.1 type II secretion system major pseudopilin GspG [Tahibacter amnicola]